MNNIQPPREGQRDHLVWICPDGVTERERDQHIKYFCRDPQAAGLQRGVRVEYEAPGDKRVTRRVRVLAAAAGGEGRQPPPAPGGQAAAPRPQAVAPDRLGDHGAGAAGGGRQPPPVPARHAVEPHPATAEDRLCIPIAAARIVEPRLSDPRPLHPGLLLDRLPTQQHISDQLHQKAHLDRVVRARPWSKGEYEAILKHLEGDGCDFMVTAKSRIALHLSRAGGLENANCCLHPVYGFAYLPGSGLKGLAAAYAGHLYETTDWSKRKEGDKERFIREVEDIFGWAPNQIRNQEKPRDADPRSARARARDHEQQRGAVVFHDAFGEAPDGGAPQLEIDVLTCHYPAYYAGEAPPGDWQSPRPVTFLTIAAGTKFRFRVRPADGATDPELVEAAKRLLLGGLHWLGAGAKTAAGYGWFDVDTWEEPPEVRQRRLQQLAEQQAHIAAQQLLKLWQSLKPDEALWVPKQDGSRRGYRLTLAADNTWQREDGWECRNVPDPISAKCLYRATINPDAPKRLMKPQRIEGLAPPPQPSPQGA